MPQCFPVRSRILGHAVLAICLLLFAGCGGSTYPLAGASGEVTLDGDLLAGARIAFQRRREGEGLDSGLGS